MPPRGIFNKTHLSLPGKSKIEEEERETLELSTTFPLQLPQQAREKPCPQVVGHCVLAPRSTASDIFAHACSQTRVSVPLALLPACWNFCFGALSCWRWGVEGADSFGFTSPVSVASQFVMQLTCNEYPNPPTLAIGTVPKNLNVVHQHPIRPSIHMHPVFPFHTLPSPTSPAPRTSPCVAVCEYKPHTTNEIS